MFWRIERLADAARGVFESTDQRFVSYAELVEHVNSLSGVIDTGRKALVLLQCDNSLASIIGYLAALRVNQAVMLVNSTTDVSLTKRLLEIYTPEIILGRDLAAPVPVGYRVTTSPVPGLMVSVAQKPTYAAIHPDTAALLSTSGTTGSPKAIRLSHRNLQSNAESIVQYLSIDPSETAITTLPMSYSYGLSVLNSHLLAGANLVLTNASMMTPDFWALFTARSCTSFAGVPFNYGILERLRFGRMELPSLRTMTQAGGRLAPEKIKLFADLAREKRARFFVMYGQTEATARISYVPWERLAEKIGSVGIPIPNGSLSIESEGKKIIDLGMEGELIYEGPNVMLGYAESRQDLAKGDEMSGRLHTGDLGYRDADGFFHITGRLKRFIKVFGLRLNLDEVEKMLESAVGSPVGCVGTDESLHVVVESREASVSAEAKRRLIELYKLHHSVVHVHETSSLPVNASGKKDYAAIARGLN